MTPISVGLALYCQELIMISRVTQWHTTSARNTVTCPLLLMNMFCHNAGGQSSRLKYYRAWQDGLEVAHLILAAIVR
jgi:hypothetical protein